MGKRWQDKRKKEHYYKKAKREGYRSRAAYKLKQLNERYNLIRPSDKVLDLGSAPGGWLQVVSELINKNGLIIGIDTQEIKDIKSGNIITIQGDITEKDTIERIKDKLENHADIILSDLSPKITGIWEVDHGQSIKLARTALKISEELLKPGGKTLIKVFQGRQFQDLVNDLKKKFSFTTISKPKASRKRSAETYIICKGFSGC